MPRRDKMLCAKSELNAQHSKMLKISQNSSPEPVGQFLRNLVCSTLDSSPLILETRACTWEKMKTVNILETIAA